VRRRSPRPSPAPARARRRRAAPGSSRSSGGAGAARRTVLRVAVQFDPVWPRRRTSPGQTAGVATGRSADAARRRALASRSRSRACSLSYSADELALLADFERLTGREAPADLLVLVERRRAGRRGRAGRNGEAPVRAGSTRPCRRAPLAASSRAALTRGATGRQATGSSRSLSPEPDVTRTREPTAQRASHPRRGSCLDRPHGRVASVRPLRVRGAAVTL
jgi:hypothetical protein